MREENSTQKAGGEDLTLRTGDTIECKTIREVIEKCMKEAVQIEVV